MKSKRALIAKLKKGRTAAQMAKLDGAIKDLDKAITLLEKYDPKTGSEGEIEKAIGDAAKKIDEANKNPKSASLDRVSKCLVDIAANLF